MVSRKRRFTCEFKVEKVRLVTDSDQRGEDVAADLEIHPNALYEWMRQFREEPDETFPGKHGSFSKIPCPFDSPLRGE
ncbi:hypothetical protein A7E78_08410 [Syntrophotalea acetylenivorans]|uniref:Transposase n=1 Tax=Syntrophotalea acetylenivorans TaxID=1842532 RepID=A0A1L3GT34_9BACT|nr:hypothetical protein A7E78_08410 [Syntrophotalea acetylenivorans]